MKLNTDSKICKSQQIKQHNMNSKQSVENKMEDVI
jgi:hypothetical protein